MKEPHIPKKAALEVLQKHGVHYNITILGFDLDRRLSPLCSSEQKAVLDYSSDGFFINVTGGWRDFQDMLRFKTQVEKLTDIMSDLIIADPDCVANYHKK